MKRMICFAAIAGTLLAGNAAGQTPSRDASFLNTVRSETPRKRSHTRSVHPLLNKRVEAVRWDEVPFIDVIDWLKDQTPRGATVNVIVRWRALLAENIDEETTVTLEMRDSTVKEILEEVLDQLSDLEPLRYMGVCKNLRISTKADFDRQPFTRVYDISYLLLVIPTFDYFAFPDLPQTLGGGGGGIGGGSGGSSGGGFGGAVMLDGRKLSSMASAIYCSDACLTVRVLFVGVLCWT